MHHTETLLEHARKICKTPVGTFSFFTILQNGYLYAIALHRQTKWQRGKVAINIKFTNKHPYAVRPEGNFQL